MPESEAVVVEQSIEDFITQENRAERGVQRGDEPVPEAAADSGDAAPEPGATAGEPRQDAVDPATERNPDGTFRPKPGKPRNDPHARVLDATAKEAAAKRERDESRAENARLKAELDALRAPKADAPKPAPQAAAPAATDDPEPQEAQYDDYRQFVKAQARWEARQEYREQTARAQEAAQQRARAEAHHTRETTWQGRLTEARTKDPAFDSRINLDTPLSAPMQYVIKESPVGIELLTWLSDHQEDAQRLSTLHPGEVLRELGKLEARLDAASPRGPALPVVPAVSHAKPPIKPLGTSPQSPDPYDTTDETPTEEWIRRENVKERRERAGR